MGSLDAGYDFDRYRRLLLEADDEPKRLAFIDLLIEEKARDRLAEQSLRARLTGMGLQTALRVDVPTARPVEKISAARRP